MPIFGRFWTVFRIAPRCLATSHNALMLTRHSSRRNRLDQSVLTQRLNGAVSFCALWTGSKAETERLLVLTLNLKQRWWEARFWSAPMVKANSLHRHTLRQIARLVHIRAPRAGGVVGQQLQRHHVQQR